MRVENVDVEKDSMAGKILYLIYQSVEIAEFEDILETIDINYVFPFTVYKLKVTDPRDRCFTEELCDIISKGDFILKIILKKNRDIAPWEYDEWDDFVSKKMLILLRKKNININLQDAKGRTILHIFNGKRNIYHTATDTYDDMFKLILSNPSCKAGIKDKKGRTVYDALQELNNSDVTWHPWHIDVRVRKTISERMIMIKKRMEIDKKAYLTTHCIKKLKLVPKDIQWMIWMKIFKLLIVDI